MEGSAILCLAAALVHHIDDTKGSDSTNRSSSDEVSAERGLRAGDGLTSLCKVDERVGERIHLFINLLTLLVIPVHACKVPINPNLIADLVWRFVQPGHPVETFTFRSNCVD